MPKIDAQLGIRVTKDLKERLTAQAKSEMKSVSTLVVQVVEAYLESVGNGKRRKLRRPKDRLDQLGQPALDKAAQV